MARHENSDQNPGAANGGSRHQHEDAASDLSESENKTYNVRHVRLGEGVGGAGQDKENCLDQNDQTQCPLQSG